MKEIKGSDVVRQMKEQMTVQIEELKGHIPHLAIIRVGKRLDDISYEKGTIKRAQRSGLRYISFLLPAEISHNQLVEEFQKVNRSPDVDGILMLRPLPKRIDEKEIESLIDVKKDIDYISPINLAKVFASDSDVYALCTAETVMEMLVYGGIELKDKRVTVVGRGLVAGKSLTISMLGQHATVTICHTKTADFTGICRNTEILVAAAGRARMIKTEHVAEGVVVIDVGINVDEDGSLCGDVDFDQVKTKAGMLTPMPGGVGNVITLVLLKHLIRSAKEKIG